MTNQSRQPAGVPTGGRFAEQTHAEVDIVLVEPPKRVPFEVQRASARLAGLRHQRSLQANAEPKRLRFIARVEGKVTLLVQHDDGSIEPLEGRLTTGGDGSVMLVPKGRRSSSGPIIDRDGASQHFRVLDLALGHGHSGALESEYEQTAARGPALVKPQFDHIPNIAEGYEPSSDVAAVYVLDHPGFDSGQDGRGVVFFATNYDPESGIVDGYMVAPSGSGMYSEHGSMHDTDIERRGGMVDGITPGAFTFSDAMDYGIKAASHDDDDIEACWDALARGHK